VKCVFQLADFACCFLLAFVVDESMVLLLVAVFIGVCGEEANIAKRKFENQKVLRSKTDKTIFKLGGLQR